MEKFEEKLKPLINIHPDIQANIISIIHDKFNYTCPCTYMNTPSFRTGYLLDITTPIAILAIYKNHSGNIYYTIAKFTCSKCHKTHYVFMSLMRKPYNPFKIELVYKPIIVSIEAIIEITNFIHKLSSNYYSENLSVPTNIQYFLNQYITYSIYSVYPQLSPAQQTTFRNVINTYYHSSSGFSARVRGMMYGETMSAIPNHVLYTMNLLDQLKANTYTQTLLMQLLNIIPETYKFYALMSI